MSNSLEFISLEVENIFAYEGLSRIDLSGCTDERNIVIVSGHNGTGKTSLLNAVKLLFLGSDSEAMRRVGFGGAPLSPKHYVSGQPGRWYGVFNNAARDFDAHASVSLEWMGDGRRFKAKRTFKRANSALGFTEELTVAIDGKPISSSEVEAFISGLAPSEVVPFYFFDGEQVQSFADAEEGRERAEIERLLGLSFVPELTRELDVFAKIKRRAGFPEEVRVAIVRAENEHRDSMARADAANRSRVEAEEEVVELRRRRERLEDQRNSLRIGISETDRKRMLSRIEILGAQRERLAAEIAEHLPPEAPWLTNLGLVRETFVALDKQIAGSADASLAGKLHRELPNDLLRRLTSLTPPVNLSDSQQHSFSSGVHEALAEQGVPVNASSNPLLGSLSPRQIRVLRDRYLVWNERGASLVASQAEKLRQIRQVTNDRAQAQRDLDEAELTTDEARHHFELLTTELLSLDAVLRERSDAAATFRLDEQRAQREAEEALDRIRRHEEKFESVARENRAYQLSLRVKRALESYRDMRRVQIRGSVENRLNQRIGILLGPSQLIKSVTLDEQFVMKYFDERGSEVARRSISAGMRQLVAMAMLWALKDEARRELPVMIDTPLGRIDRQNRALLMTEYFPMAGKPLVLLPTNSEIGGEDYGQLSDRIVRRYEIKNEGGLQARIVELNASLSERSYAP
ncbi:AAA family ATPase [Ralstonia solanacearum]|uniref:AAA family ATPase n=1 Tax=Ralstonia solanacearum TaxID=305 RepID=A0AAW5ZVL4_RALSL|nr:AAA family ATPase [Ralstonia solanacearum]MDB0573530.1 AAA family ATPase [Ralstonia solanacearum]